MKKKKKAINCVEANNKSINDPNEVCVALADYFFKIPSNSNLSHEYREIKNKLEKSSLKCSTSPDTESFNMPFTLLELQEVTKNLKETSKGEDGTYNLMLKNLTKSGQDAFLRIVNRILNEQVFPSQWQSAIIIPIPKPEKDSKNPFNILGISLICE